MKTQASSTQQGTRPAERRRGWWLGLCRVAAGLLVPLVLYYGLRAADVSIYLALLISAVASAVPTAVGIFRHKQVNGLSAYFTVMVVGSVAVSLIAGSTQLLLAKEALLTGVTGVWFLVSVLPAKSTSRPLSYAFSKPLLEGRLRWPNNFEELWTTSSRWRRMWRVSSALFGIGIFADAVLRVVFAYTLPADTVPALATGMYAATSVLLIAASNIYYLLCGVHNRGSALYHKDLAP